MTSTVDAPTAKPKFRLTDSTLRDGSHAVAHQYTEQQVIDIVAGLDRAGVPVIEVSHGDGLGGSSFNYGFSGTDEMTLIKRAVETAKQAKIACLLLPGIGVADDLKAINDAGVQVARIATHCTEADIAEQHIGMAKELGMEAVGFLMMAHMTSPEELLRQALIMQESGADLVYCVDSAGALTTETVRQRIETLVGGLDVPVGLHAHENLSLSVANSLTALDHGALHIDACTGGAGAGAGNCPTEVFVAVCDRMGLETGVDTMAMVDVAEEIVRPAMNRPQMVDRAALILGYAGVYGSFMLHSERAAKRYGVSQAQILIELGKRGVVGGQEDMIIDVALELAAKK
ncbi:MAG TPA: 4-hydroxy-2-oxovalerate aldolase [Jatrophihabitantaceae bacterium]|nr:4-hydroxy-2-oxovalerate aldolase [Jatrophihabitantaceae bacterium]